MLNILLLGGKKGSSGAKSVDEDIAEVTESIKVGF